INAIMLIQLEFPQHARRQLQGVGTGFEIQPAGFARSTQATAKARFMGPAGSCAALAHRVPEQLGMARYLLGCIWLDGRHGLLADSRACACSESGNWLSSRLL